MKYHIPVLLKEAVDLLDIKNGNVYVDGTLGGGGHFREIISKLDEGIVIGIDLDLDAIKLNEEELLQLGFLKKDEHLFIRGDVKAFLFNENFKNIDKVLKEASHILSEEFNVNGILFDLGVSSYQIDQPSKGFSYMHDSPLDMRMSLDLSVKAEDLVNGLYENELTNILINYGEEVFAKRIARNIVKERKLKKISTSNQLKEVIKKSVPFTYRNPYAKTFRALRIAVNDELGNLRDVVEKVDSILNKEGRIVFISFHSLEDRIVKLKFLKNNNYEEIEKYMEPSLEEIEQNIRSRSAKLRCFKKIK